jgi:hypothetical protein
MTGQTVKKPSVFLFFFFKLFPVYQHFIGVFYRGIAKDMGMAVYQLFRESFNHIFDGELALLSSDFRLQKNLEQQVAKLLANFTRAFVVDGIKDFVGFFYNERF